MIGLLMKKVRNKVEHVVVNVGVRSPDDSRMKFVDFAKYVISKLPTFTKWTNLKIDIQRLFKYDSLTE